MLVSIKQVGNGVNKDLLPSELLPGQWSDALNVRFRNKFAEKRKGVQPVFTTPTVIPYALAAYATSTARFIVQAGLAKVFVDDGTTRTEITGTAPTGAIDDRWCLGVLNGVLIASNGKDNAAYWNGDTGTDLATLTGWTNGWKSDSIRPFKNYLVALGNTRGGAKKPHNVGWSNAAEPGAIPTLWTAAATNDAGDVDLAETPGVMVDSLPLGDVNIIYKQDARYAMQYIGGNDVFRFQRLPGNDGLLNRGCVVNTPKGHVFMSNGDIKLHQGGEAISIADGRIRNWIFTNIDSTYASRSFLCLNPLKTEVWVCFPSYGNSVCNKVCAWNWNDDTWGIFDVASLTAGTSGLVPASLISDAWSSDSESWASDVTAWVENEYSQNDARLILATSTLKIGLADTGGTDFGTSVPATLEKTGISLDDPDTIKILNRLRPQLKATAGSQVSVYLGSSMTADAPPTYATAATFTVGTSNWANAFAKGGRYMAVKITGPTQQLFSMASYDMEFVKDGRE